MPDAKLTLKLDRDIIEQGKLLAEKRGTSLSRMVETLLQAAASTLPSSEEASYETYVENGKTYIRNPWGIKLEEPSWYCDIQESIPADYSIKDYILERYG